MNPLDYITIFWRYLWGMRQEDSWGLIHVEGRRKAFCQKLCPEGTLPAPLAVFIASAFTLCAIRDMKSPEQKGVGYCPRLDDIELEVARMTKTWIKEHTNHG